MFAHRIHKAYVNLMAGESIHFQLPPTTTGKLVFKVERFTVGSADQAGDHTVSGTAGSGSGGNTPRRIDSGVFRDRGDILVAGGRIETGVRASARRAPINPLDNLILDPEIEPGSVDNPAEITLELYHDASVVQAVTGQHINYDGQGSGLWTLKMTRAADGTTDRRRYRIDGQYPSVLPLLDRRIPMHLLQSALDEYWNVDNQYLQRLEINEHRLFYQWDKQLADLYGFEYDSSTVLTEEVTLPRINAKTWRLEMGATDPLINGTRVPFLRALLEFECEDNDPKISLPYSLGSVDLPKTFSFEVRLGLGATSGILLYSVEIITDLDMGNWTMLLGVVPFATYANDMIKLAGVQLFNAQWKDGANSFDELFRAVALGDYEVVEVEYDDQQDDIVMWYVGKPVELDITRSTASLGGHPWGDLPDLFEAARDEVWAPPKIVESTPIRRRRKTDPGDLAKVDHIVVLMQENRSFDEILGYLSRDGIAPLGVQKEVDGLAPAADKRDVNTYTFSANAQPREFVSEHSTDTSWPDALVNPGHSRDNVRAQMMGGMKNFVANYAARLDREFKTEKNLQRIMDYHTDAELPVFGELAKEFAICDRWFGSHIGGTHPNRHIFYSGELNVNRHGYAEEENSEFPGYVASERLTLFDHLTERGVSWKIYEHGYSFLRMYWNYTFDDERIVPFDDDLRGFDADARTGRLPQVAFIEPDYIEAPGGNDDHCPADMWNGQILVAKIVRSLIDYSNFNDGKWLFAITYDEHGGFYDHVVPPDSIEIEDANGNIQSYPIPALQNDVRQLGPRCPSFLISPYIPRGEGKVNVSHQVLEHASVAATILRRFCSPYPPVMPPRIEAAADFRSVLTLPTARPGTDFVTLLRVCNEVANSPERRSGQPTPVWNRKLPKSAETELLNEDFGGLVAALSSLTGRNVRA